MRTDRKEMKTYLSRLFQNMFYKAETRMDELMSESSIKQYLRLLPPVYVHVIVLTKHSAVCQMPGRL